MHANVLLVDIATAAVALVAAVAAARALILAPLDVPGEAWVYVVSTLGAFVFTVIVAVRVAAAEAAAPPPRPYQALRNASTYTKMLALSAGTMSLATIVAAAHGALWRDALGVVAAFGLLVLVWYLGSMLPYPPRPRRAQD